VGAGAWCVLFSPSDKPYHNLSVHLLWVTSLLSDGTDTPYQSVSNLFSRIHQLPRLETVKLLFFTRPAQSELRGISGSESRSCLQAPTLTALATSFSVRAPSELTSLSLENLLVSNFPPLEPLPRIIPAPVQQSLTDLDMGNDITIGSSSGLSFAGLYFPHLCTLSLYNLFWEPSLDIEPFVLRHATTLAQLKLTLLLPVRHQAQTPLPIPIYGSHRGRGVENQLGTHLGPFRGGAC
jgi:hypothetical protein